MTEKGRNTYSSFGLRTYFLKVTEVGLLPAGEGVVII